MKTEVNKYQLACQCFLDLQENCENGGGKVTITSVARCAGVDRKYFYGKINTSDVSLQKKWASLGKEIGLFKAIQKKRSEEATEPEVSLKKELQNSLIENYRLSEDFGRLNQTSDILKRQLSDAKFKIENLESKLIKLEESVHIESVSLKSVAFINSRPIIVSPDAFRSGVDALAMRKSWVAALNELRKIIERNVDMVLYLTVGAPGSGKTTWCSNFDGSRKLSILFDACNLTRADRYEILDLVAHKKNVHVVAVLFFVALTDLLERNRNRSSKSRISEDKIHAFFNSIEWPVLTDDAEVFKEIIMLRN